MTRLRHDFSSLSASIDELHEVLDRWTGHNGLKKALEPDAVERMRLAVHEWVANLVQHADFSEEEPEVRFCIAVENGRVKVIVVDNSNGFDLDNQGELRKQALADTILPERGMGIPIIMACTDDLRYRCRNDGINRMEFYVADDEDPCLNIPF